MSYNFSVVHVMQDLYIPSRVFLVIVLLPVMNYAIEFFLLSFL